MALSFIGKSISLISHSDVRYRGILAGIDPAASTIQLSNVYSMGTESRRPAAEYIPPVAEPYQYIIFRASEVKDLSVDEPTPRRSVHDDPAVVGASAPTVNPPYPTPQNNIVTPNQVPQSQPPMQPATEIQVGPLSQAPTTGASRGNNHQNSRGGRPNPVHTAAASLETVERALGDLRVSQSQSQNNHTNNHHPNVGRGGRRVRGPRADAEQIKVPSTDFDFESSNAKFDKGALSPAAKPDEKEGATSAGEEGGNKEGTANKEDKAYNPQKSFFDSLSSSAATPPAAAGSSGGQGAGRGRRGGGGAGKNRREEERERNVATFGEPGGVGLMGPGAYVGGWGGYGRRGGRPRRGGGRGGQSNSETSHTVQARG